MKIRYFALLLSAFFFITLSTTVSAHDPSKHGFSLTLFDPPFPAPAFDLSTFPEGQASLEDYKGQYVLLNFWATWCPPCLEEMPSMESAFQRFKDRGFTVVAISSDEEGETAIKPFIDKLGVTFPILMDPDKAISSVYGASNLPVTFVLDRDGQVIAGSIGGRDWASEEALSVLDELIVDL